MSGSFLIVLALAALPAVGNFAGGLMAEIWPISERTLSLALHGAAGVVLAVVGVELLPQAVRVEPPWMIVLAFIAGGGFFVLVDGVVERVGKGAGKSDRPHAGTWAIFVGVAVDLLSDGLMIGAGSTITLDLGLLLALGQVTADIPEGFATIAAFRQQGLPRRARLLLAASFVVPVLAGAALGYWVVRGRGDALKLALLSFTAGVLTTLVVEGMIPQAHELGEARLATLIFVGGFALFTLLSLYLGS
jgi:ZIP family zinc transporter